MYNEKAALNYSCDTKCRANSGWHFGLGGINIIIVRIDFALHRISRVKRNQNCTCADAY